VFLVVDLTLACWALLEGFLRVRDFVTGNGRSDRDRATRILIGVALAAIVRRIHVEEAELNHVLGERYRRYQAHTKRLIPGRW